MSKHGWMWRTQQVSRLSPEELVALALSPRMSPKMARWVYRDLTGKACNRDGDHEGALAGHLIELNACLINISSNFFKEERVTWVKHFLRRELELHKSDLLGEFVVEALAVYVSEDKDSAERLMDLYEDETAHPFTRGNALFTLSFSKVPEQLRERFLRIAREALHHPTNAYARCTACMLIDHDPDFGTEDIAHLLNDHEGLKPGCGPTVASYAKSALLEFSTEPRKTLYRPVGQAELDLILETGKFPPRLPVQPIFYPVLNLEYAVQVARDWNTKDAASGFVGYVTKFEVKTAFLERYEIKTVGSNTHQEYWIPAEDLEQFNDNIVGTICTVATFRGKP